VDVQNSVVWIVTGDVDVVLGGDWKGGFFALGSPVPGEDRDWVMSAFKVAGGMRGQRQNVGKAKGISQVRVFEIDYSRQQGWNVSVILSIAMLQNGVAIVNSSRAEQCCLMLREQETECRSVEHLAKVEVGDA
jgi:hypothetical protein